MYISNDHDNWHTLRPFLTYAYNTAVQNTTGFSPFFLLYNREATSTIDSLFPYTDIVSPHRFVAEAVSRAEECRQLARSRTTQHQQQQKLRYDERHFTVTYSPGTQVWVWTPVRTPGLCEKLLHRYLGPYRIVKAASPVTYVVEPIQPRPDRRYRGKETVHVSKIKPFVERPSQEDDDH